MKWFINLLRIAISALLKNSKSSCILSTFRFFVLSRLDLALLATVAEPFQYFRKQLAAKTQNYNTKLA
jgi:hypothetical protein